MSESIYETGGETAKSGYVEALEQQLRRKEREIEKLREQVDGEPRVRTIGGTPNLSGEVSAKLAEGPAHPTDFEDSEAEDLALHRLMIDGPDALTDEHTPTYPVHERAYEVLINAPSLARDELDGGSMRLTAPTVKRFLESKEDDHLKHTQVRRVFETLQDAGKRYPRPPTLHKNRDGIIELVIYDYPRLFDRTVLD